MKIVILLNSEMIILYYLFFVSGIVYVYYLVSFYKSKRNEENRVKYYKILKRWGYVLIGTWILSLIIILFQIFCRDGDM